MRSLLLLSLPLALVLTGCQNERVNVAVSRSTAEKWVADVLPGYKVVGFSSATLDSDGDGYITCEVTVSKDGGETMKLIQLAAPTHGKMFEIQKGDAAKLHQIPFNNSF